MLVLISKFLCKIQTSVEFRQISYVMITIPDLLLDSRTLVYRRFFILIRKYLPKCVALTKEHSKSTALPGEQNPGLIALVVKQYPKCITQPQSYHFDQRTLPQIYCIDLRCT